MRRMIIPLRSSKLMKVRIQHSLPSNTHLRNTNVTSIWRSDFLASHPGTHHFKIQGILCDRIWTPLILSLHALHIHIPEIQSGQWHYNCSHSKSQPFSVQFTSLTVHHLSRRPNNPKPIETRMIHNTRQVETRMFPNGKQLLWR